jgi:hypothetical protein
MGEYRVTFGQRYAKEPHPTWTAAHPDGWVTVIADDCKTARRWAYANFGIHWCDLYEADAHPSTDAELYPLGELARFRNDSEDDGYTVADMEADGDDA